MKSEKNKKFIAKTVITIWEMLPLFALAMGCVLVLNGIQNFWIGYHNVDLGQNLKYLNTKYNITLVDQASNDELWSASYMLHKGYEQQRESIKFIGYGSLLFGIGIMQLIYTIISSTEKYYKRDKHGNKLRK